MDTNRSEYKNKDYILNANMYMIKPEQTKINTARLIDGGYSDIYTDKNFDNNIVPFLTGVDDFLSGLNVDEILDASKSIKITNKDLISDNNLNINTSTCVKRSSINDKSGISEENLNTNTNLWLTLDNNELSHPSLFNSWDTPKFRDYGDQYTKLDDLVNSMGRSCLYDDDELDQACNNKDLVNQAYVLGLRVFEQKENNKSVVISLNFTLNTQDIINICSPYGVLVGVNVIGDTGYATFENLGALKNALFGLQNLPLTTNGEFLHVFIHQTSNKQIGGIDRQLYNSMPINEFSFGLSSSEEGKPLINLSKSSWYNDLTPNTWSTTASRSCNNTQEFNQYGLWHSWNFSNNNINNDNRIGVKLGQDDENEEVLILNGGVNMNMNDLLHETIVRNIVGINEYDDRDRNPCESNKDLAISRVAKETNNSGLIPSFNLYSHFNDEDYGYNKNKYSNDNNLSFMINKNISYKCNPDYSNNQNIKFNCANQSSSPLLNINHQKEFNRNNITTIIDKSLESENIKRNNPNNSLKNSNYYFGESQANNSNTVSSTPINSVTPPLSPQHNSNCVSTSNVTNNNQLINISADSTPNIGPCDSYSLIRKYTARYEVQIPPDNKFQIARRIIGTRGVNMKKIFKLTQAKLRLRGIGSGYLEGYNKQEADEPLHLCISSLNYEQYINAKSQVEKLLQKIYQEYNEYLESNGINKHFNLEIKCKETLRTKQSIDI